MAPRNAPRPGDVVAWVKWLRGFGARRFYRAFVELAQGAEGRCTNCHQDIYLDIVEGGGVPDWRTANGDYGCDANKVLGSHTPRKG